MMLQKPTLSLVVWMLAAALASAQTPGQGRQAVTLTQSVEPSFRIEPVVLRFNGRRGEVIPFEFLITSTGKTMDVELMPVSLRQEPSGIILFDESRPPSAATKITSASEFRLQPGQSRKITGTVTVPMPKTNYLSFGILVRDKGQKPKFSNEQAKNTEAAVRFVTQYVLRVDVEVTGSSESDLRRLRLQEGRVRSKQGMPVAEAILVNDTDYSFEFQVRGLIKSGLTGGRPRPFLLGMPSRSDMKEPDRHLVRVMPHSRLRLEAALAEVLMPGNQEMQLGISSGRREVVSAVFPVSVNQGDFPALDAKTAIVGEMMSVTPAHLKLGQLRGNARVAALTFQNHSKMPAKVELSVEPFVDGDMSSFKLSPKSFEVRPGRSKHVRAILTSKKEAQNSEQGYIRIQARDADGEEASHQLPLALLYAEPQKPNVAFSQVQLDSQPDSASFTVYATNNGEHFVPLDGILNITDGRGRNLQIPAGHGRWLRPGETFPIQFPTGIKLSAGQYQLALQMSSDGQSLLDRTVIVNLSESPGPVQPVSVETP